MLKLIDLGLTYFKDNKPFKVLENINLQIEKGERLVVIGPSGCGKSSLLKLVSGLITPTHGKVLYNEKPLKNPHKEIEFILQNYGLFPWKTVKQNIALPLQIQKLKAKEIEALTKPLLEKLGLLEHQNQFPAQLSGGQQQRVGIARALITNPKLLLMDEPFSALDELTRESLQNTVLKLCQEENLTLIMVTHNLEEVVFLGGNILIFGEGVGKIIKIIRDKPNQSFDYRNKVEFYQKCSDLRKLIRS